MKPGLKPGEGLRQLLQFVRPACDPRQQGISVEPVQNETDPPVQLCRFVEPGCRQIGSGGHFGEPDLPLRTPRVCASVEKFDRAVIVEREDLRRSSDANSRTEILVLKVHLGGSVGGFILGRV